MIKNKIMKYPFADFNHQFLMINFKKIYLENLDTDSTFGPFKVIFFVANVYFIMLIRY